METFFSRYKNPLVLAFVLVAQFFLLAIQVRRPFPAATARVDQAGVRALRYGVTTVVAPPEIALHKSGLSLRSVWSSYLDLIGVREQNARLREEVEQLRLEQAALAEDARQGQRLQDLLAFRQHYINSTVPAQVVGTAGTDRSRELLLDKGSDDGIAVDMPVITPDGIVGRVREVFPHTSQVLEISDPTSAAGVLLEETRTRGILRGNSNGQPQIVNLMPDDRIKPGQLVLTSGGDQIFPRGLPVGIVDHTAPDRENEPMVDVVLKPAANLGRLEEVLIVTGTGSAPTARARADLSKSELAAAGVRAAKEAAAAAAAAQQAKEAQRASDVLAQRLPSRSDPTDPDAPDASPDASPATSEAAAKPLHPPSALHPDHYSPTGVPPAQALTPGQRYAPLVEGTPATERRANTAAATDGLNATDTAPVGTNPAFSAASAAVQAQHKAIADARAADAARRYAALHPTAPAADSAAAAAGSTSPATALTTPKNGDTAPAGSSSAVPSAVRYINRTNADGTITRVAVPALPAAGTPGVRYITRTNADGTVSRVAVPVLPSTTAGTTTPGIRYVTRTNADGTVTRVAVPAVPSTTGTPATSASTVHYINRTNADGTVTRVAVPGPAPATASPATASSVRYVTRTNADGTVTRVAVPVTPSTTGTPATSASTVHYVNRTNADGTVTRVAVPGPAPATASPAAPTVRYVTRTNADGTVTRVAVPLTPSTTGTPAPSASTVHYVNRTNADGTVTRVAVPGPAPATASPATASPGTASPATAPTVRYVTRTNADGTVTRIAVPVTPAAPRPAAAGAANAAAATPGSAGAVAPRASVPTRIIADGPLPSRAPSPRVAGTSPAVPPNRTAGTGPSRSAANTQPAPRRSGPTLVPDDGSRPPVRLKPAPAPATTPQAQN